MQLVDSAKLDMSATAYANDVKKGIYQFLKSQNADSLAKNLGKSQPVQDLQVWNILFASFIWMNLMNLFQTKSRQYDGKYDGFVIFVTARGR